MKDDDRVHLNEEVDDDQLAFEIWADGSSALLAEAAGQLVTRDPLPQGVDDVLTALAVLERRFSESDVKPI